MSQVLPSGLAPPVRPSRRTPLPALLAAAAGLAALAGVAGLREGRRPVPETSPPTTVASPLDGIGLLDPRPWHPAGASSFGRAAPLAAAFRSPPAEPGRAPVAVLAVRRPAAPPALSPSPPPAAPVRLAETPAAMAAPPLPVPRPAELRAAPEEPRRVERQPARRARVAAAPAAPAEEPGFFEKLFGLPRSPAPALAYAALEPPGLPRGPFSRLTPGPSLAATAIYDISARTVTLPNGERLEAHSGLGERMDDPRHVHVRMRGATPPGTYDLTEREALFHGVRAIRLNPVGGPPAVHGRTGLLAHTYMLGPRGDSNGCVSFRDYDRFLQAFLRGEVRRLVVVAGDRGALPRLADARG